MDRSQRLAGAAWAAMDGPAMDGPAMAPVAFTGAGALASALHVTDLAAASVAAAGLAVAELLAAAGHQPPDIRVDRRLAAFWFAGSIRPIGWQVPAPWDSIAGDYAARDGWIRLHTNAPHHRAAAERVLGTQADRAAMAEAVRAWDKATLEQAIVEAGGCAAEMRTQQDWAAHPQGQAVAAEPLVQVAWTPPAPAPGWAIRRDRPLQGLRVLDLTRVLAGPVATRLLAGLGADVLRIDPPWWDEPGVVPEVTLGKRCARLDLHAAADRATFETLLTQADVVLHGYRPGALDGLGFGAARRRHLQPGLIDVSLCAYGWSGPWALRRGFDSLVQMSAGIAAAGQAWRGADKPVPLPVQALDHATGYLMAAMAIRGVARRLADGRGVAARLSLARTAKFLADAGPADELQPLAPETGADLAAAREATMWGEALRLRFPLQVSGVEIGWPHPAGALGTAPACFTAR